MSTNIAENMNSVLRYAHKLPICTLIEFIYDWVQKCFYERCDAVANIEKQLSPTTSSYVQKSLDIAQYMKVNLVDILIYHVKGVRKDRVENLK